MAGASASTSLEVKHVENRSDECLESPVVLLKLSQEDGNT